jgi:hypothetical protein
MANRRPDYKVFVSRNIAKEGEETQNYFTEVGAAWCVDREGISINLVALPTDGKLVMFPRKDE